MKGKFIAHTNLMQVETALKEHKPYAALVVSTTGLDSIGFSEHSPTRVVLKEFEYDEDLKSYKSTIGFDKMVKAPQSAIDKALENIDNYDVFANGGIDKDKYIAGENVLSVSDFQKEFASVISAFKEDGATLIINGDRKFAETYLGKIGCADGIIELAEAGKVVEQTRMTQEYFQRNGITSKTARLEDLRNAITASPTGSFYKNDQLMTDFRNMSKEDFLKAHPDVAESKYALTQREVETRESKIVGGDNRINVIDSFVTKYGRDEKLLISEWQEQQKEAEVAIREDMSEKGKEKYKNSGLDDKFKTLIETGALKPDGIEQGKSEFHKLINAVEDKNNKGIVIIHAASTGFEKGKLPQSTGFPIQFTALVCERDENGHLNTKHNPRGITFNIEAPSKSLQNAIKNITDPNRPYDTFKETGIDLDEYKAKKNVRSADEATEKVNKFFKKYPTESYPLIAIGGTKGSNYSFTQTCMSNLGNFAMCEAEYIDFAQAIKDYSYLAYTDDKYPKNAIVDESAFEKCSFSLRDIAEARGDKRPASTEEMCLETGRLISFMEQQQIELFRPEELVELSDSQPAPKKEDNKAVENKAPDDAAKPQPTNDSIPTEELLGFSKSLSAVPESEKQPKTTRSISELFEPPRDRQTQAGAPKEPSAPSRPFKDIPPFDDEPFFDVEEDIRPISPNTRMGRPTVPPRFRNEGGSGPNDIKAPRTRFGSSAANASRPENERNENADMSRLLEVIEKQNAVIRDMNSRLASLVEQTTERLANVVVCQDELMKAVVVALSDRTEELEKDDVFRETEDELTVSERLENIIGAIDNVRENVPTNRAQTHLMNAKQALDSAVNEIDRADSEKKQRTAS